MQPAQNLSYITAVVFYIFLWKYSELTKQTNKNPQCKHNEVILKRSGNLKLDIQLQNNYLSQQVTYFGFDDEWEWK